MIQMALDVPNYTQTSQMPTIAVTNQDK